MSKHPATSRPKIRASSMFPAGTSKSGSFNGNPLVIAPFEGEIQGSPKEVGHGGKRIQANPSRSRQISEKSRRFQASPFITRTQACEPLRLGVQHPFWWCEGWFGGLVVWWFGGLVVWWVGGLVAWWCGGLVVLLVVWWFTNQVFIMRFHSALSRDFVHSMACSQENMGHWSVPWFWFCWGCPRMSSPNSKGTTKKISSSCTLTSLKEEL